MVFGQPPIRSGTQIHGAASIAVGIPPAIGEIYGAIAVVVYAITADIVRARMNRVIVVIAVAAQGREAISVVVHRDRFGTGIGAWGADRPCVAGLIGVATGGCV
jgi:hypothetical protein